MFHSATAVSGVRHRRSKATMRVRIFCSARLWLGLACWFVSKTSTSPAPATTQDDGHRRLTGGDERLDPP